MVPSFKYWNACVDPPDMEALWMDPKVRTEWINAGETKGQNVHLSRGHDGQPYLTQTEMKAVAEIIVRRHFVSQIDLDMICAIAELESDRQPTATRYNKKTKEISVGIMQILPEKADWLVRDLGYRAYDVQGNSELLYRPFVNVYLGAAYLKWLSNYDQKERSEEFIVRAYKGGPKKATHKSTLQFWNQYLSVKGRLLSSEVSEVGPIVNGPSASATSVQHTTGIADMTWDSKASPEDLEEMWNHPDVTKEWSKSGEKRGKVRFSHDAEKRPYLSRVELRAVAEIMFSKYFSTKAVKPCGNHYFLTHPDAHVMLSYGANYCYCAWDLGILMRILVDAQFYAVADSRFCYTGSSRQTTLCALAEIISLRFVHGVVPRPGIMGIDYSTARWLYKDLGYKAYMVQSVDDLTRPFVSMYFGAAYLAWLSQYEGRERTTKFVVQAYLAGPKNVNLQETGPLWLKFEETLSRFRDMKK